MSDERYIKVSGTDLRGKRDADVYMTVALRWAAAQGQRVETIRRCTAHGAEARGSGAATCWVYERRVSSGSRSATPCVFETGTLILPPADAPHA